MALIARQCQWIVLSIMGATLSMKRQTIAEEIYDTLQEDIIQNQNKASLGQPDLMGEEKDFLLRITEAVRLFISLKHRGMEITDRFICIRAKMFRDHLLQKHAEQPFLTEQEVQAMQKFKATDVWCRQQMSSFPCLRKNKKRHRKEGTITVNGEPYNTPEFYYDPDELDRNTKKIGTMKVGGERVEAAIHEWTNKCKGKEGSRPRAFLNAGLVEKLNPPLIDDSKGGVVEIEFSNDRRNTVFFAKENSSCPLLKGLYKCVDQYKQKLKLFCQEIREKSWQHDNLAGGKYLAAGFAMRGGTQGSPADLPFLRNECAYKLVMELHDIYASIAGWQARILDKYCPLEFMENHDTYRDGEDCIYPTPAAQRKGQMISEGLHLNMNQIALRVMSNELIDFPKKLQVLRMALHNDEVDVSTPQPLTFVPMGGVAEKGGRVIDSDLMVFEHKYGGQCYQLRTSIEDTIVMVLMCSSEQLHGSAHDRERSGFDKTCSSLRFIPYGRKNVLNFIERRRRGETKRKDGKAFTNVILKEHIHLGKGDSKVGDEVCASFGKGRSKRLLNAILVEIDGKHYFHWHQDDTRTLCNRSRVFSKYCSLANAQDCTHCNPSLSSA